MCGYQNLMAMAEDSVDGVVYLLIDNEGEWAPKKPVLKTRSGWEIAPFSVFSIDPCGECEGCSSGSVPRTITRLIPGDALYSEILGLQASDTTEEEGV